MRSPPRPAPAARASQDYSALIGKIPKKALTRVNAVGIAPTVKGIANLAKRYNLTPKQIRTVIKAVGVDTTVKAVRRVSGEVEKTRKAKGDLPNFERGVKGSVDKANKTAKTGGKNVREGLEREAAKTRANMPQLVPSVNSAASAARGAASSGGRGSALRSSRVCWSA